jgi:hypothetical protein
MIRRLLRWLLWPLHDWQLRRFWRKECAKQGHSSCYEAIK